MTTLRPFNIKIKASTKYEGKEKRKANGKNTPECPQLQLLSFSSIILFKTLSCGFKDFKDF